ncbi:ABC transporter ATP-binding protein [Gramella sp. MT6]|uniref:ABC transporter ATP-binding protein n=1 Tax=Gramella sp. MT6 TaxID=2705471 RepID=UPI001C5E713B|nr:ABC transporter ATP-binding protein [Gramella sp. MT6]QYA24669.1 ABC transporter ATP-binding protein [Gramella sp. MT6]
MILKLENISKSYAKKPVLKDVSFQLEEGTLTGIVGENGSGKSTLMRIIAGDISGNRGKVQKNGKTGYCPQEPILFPEITVQEHFRYFSAAYYIEPEVLNERVEVLLEHFNYRKYYKTRISKLSGGTRQKLNLSIALLHEPELLILDEPYNGFDWDTYLKFWDYTKSLKEKGCAVLVVSHLISEKKKFDRIYKLENGILR